MNPDDPRHGTYAGYQRHMATDKTPCEPCREASRAYSRKKSARKRNGTPNARALSTVERQEDLEFLADMGVGLVESAERFGLSVRSLEHWCQRNGLHDLVGRLRRQDEERTGHGTRVGVLRVMSL